MTCLACRSDCWPLLLAGEVVYFCSPCQARGDAGFVQLELFA